MVIQLHKSKNCSNHDLNFSMKLEKKKLQQSALAIKGILEHIYNKFFQIHVVVFTEGVSVHSQQKVKFREYFEYSLMGEKLIEEHLFDILITPKSY